MPELGDGASKKDLEEVKAATDFLLQGEITKRDPFELQTFEALRGIR